MPSAKTGILQSIFNVPDLLHEVLTASRRRWREKFKPPIERRVRTQGRTRREGAGYGDRFHIVTLRRSSQHF